MTSREDLLDQYISDRIRGADSPEAPDPDLQHLTEVVDRLRGDEDIDWPDDGFANRLALRLQRELAENPYHANGLPMSGQDDSSAGAPPAPGQDEPVPITPARNRPRRYLRELAGIAAAGLLVAIFAGALAWVFGSWGDDSGDLQPGAIGDLPVDVSGSILFIEYDGDHQISRIDASGGEPDVLSTRYALRAEARGIDWSPDGERVAFFAPEEPEQWSPSAVRTVDADGTNERLVTDEPISAGLRLDAELEWAPNGQNLAVVYIDPEVETTRIGMVYVENGRFDPVPPGEDPTTSNDTLPAWSPDSQQLAFVRATSDGQRGIYLIRFGATEAEPIVEHASRATQPAWSPEGERIAYIGPRDEGERAGLNIVDLRSGDVTEVTGHDRWDYLPRWSSRNQIAFLSDESGRDYNLFVVNPDGSGLENLTEGYDWRIYEPNWSPDGRYLTFTASNTDQDRWRLHIHDIDTGERYTIYESDNPLHTAKWRPEQTTIERPDDTPEPDDSTADLDIPEEEIAIHQAIAQELFDGDTTPVLEVNGEPVPVRELRFNTLRAELSLFSTGRMLEEAGPPESDDMVFFTALHELIEETGTETVGLALTIADAAIWQWAETEGLLATQEEIEDGVEQQRDMIERFQEEEPAAAAIHHDIYVDAIGEDRYWDEYIPLAMERSITEQNIMEAATDGTPGVAMGGLSALQTEEIAHLQAELVEAADITITDDALLGDADFAEAMRYNTVTYPDVLAIAPFSRSSADQGSVSVPDDAIDPADPEGSDGAVIPSAPEAESTARDHAAVEGVAVTDLLEVEMITPGQVRDDLPQEIIEIDIPVWRVQFALEDGGDTTFWLSQFNGSLVLRSETAPASP